MSLGGAPTLESNYWFGAQGNRLWVGQVEGDGETSLMELNFQITTNLIV